MATNNIKFFCLNNLAVESGIRSVENALQIDLGHSAQDESDIDAVYYPQFSENSRNEAAAMARHYEVFYCLEASIRELIRERLADEFGLNWWEQEEVVPPAVKQNAAGNKAKELKTGITPRAGDMLAYTTFGELGEIIKTNWQYFEDTLKDIQAVERILAGLNTLRGPIAHCCQLADDEVERLRLSLRDWFRQME